MASLASPPAPSLVPIPSRDAPRSAKRTKRSHAAPEVRLSTEGAVVKSASSSGPAQDAPAESLLPTPESTPPRPDRAREQDAPQDPLPTPRAGSSSHKDRFVAGLVGPSFFPLPSSQPPAPRCSPVTPNRRVSDRDRVDLGPLAPRVDARRGPPAAVVRQGGPPALAHELLDAPGRAVLPPSRATRDPRRRREPERVPVAARDADRGPRRRAAGRGRDEPRALRSEDVRPPPPSRGFVWRRRRTGNADPDDPRRFLAALICASKYLQDKNYSNRAWAKISGLAPAELARNERAVLGLLEYRLHLGAEDFDRCALPSFSPPFGSSLLPSPRPLPNCPVTNPPTFVRALSRKTAKDVRS